MRSIVDVELDMCDIDTQPPIVKVEEEVKIGRGQMLRKDVYTGLSLATEHFLVSRWISNQPVRNVMSQRESRILTPIGKAIH